MQQELWAVDIDFGPSDILVMAQTMSRITNVEFNPAIGQLLTVGGEKRQRYAVVSCHLWHSNLSIVQHDVFFRMCKSHLIGYNPKVGCYHRSCQTDISGSYTCRHQLVCCSV